MAKSCSLCQYGRLFFASALLGCLVWFIVLQLSVGLSVPWWLWIALIANLTLVIWAFLGFLKMLRHQNNL